jgi:hypothetical protein
VHAGVAERGEVGRRRGRLERLGGEDQVIRAGSRDRLPPEQRFPRPDEVAFLRFEENGNRGSRVFE